jgi:ABC-2 type transport system ATP-binding protein
VSPQAPTTGARTGGAVAAGGADGAVVATGVTVQYGQMVAVDGVDLTVQAGEVVGIIGPNGAGKTSLVECIEGLRRPASGSIRVAGFDPLADRARMAEVAGVQLQHTSYPPRIRVGELCQLFSGLYPDPADWRALLDEFDLAAQVRNQAAKLSGGQQQRLGLALALLGRPRVVFLDELTTGLDPAARRSVWQGLQRRNEAGLTVLLTSHYMDEVERLCDRVAVMAAGRFVAVDSVAGLVAEHGAATELMVIENAATDDELRAEIGRIPGATVSQAGNRLQVGVREPEQWPLLEGLIERRALACRRLRPSLEDVYLELTGEPVLEGVVDDAR